MVAGATPSAAAIRRAVSLPIIASGRVEIARGEQGLAAGEFGLESLELFEALRLLLAAFGLLSLQSQPLFVQPPLQSLELGLLGEGLVAAAG